jgi:hypothetical protein
MGTYRVYINPRALLTVENAGGKQLGNCYYASYYKVISLKPMSKELLRRLQETGAIGNGQEFSCWYVDHTGQKVSVPDTIDWTFKPEPTGKDLVPCVEMDPETKKILRSPSINPYSGLPDQPHEEGYYVYECEVRVDSSD